MVPEFFDPEELTEEAHQVSSTDEIPFASAQDEVRSAWRFKNKRPNVYQSRVTGYRFAIEREQASYAASKSGQQDVHGWLKGFLKIDRIVSKLNQGIEIDRLLSQLDLSKCPAVNLNLSAVHRRTQASNIIKDNDVDDWLSVAAIPYADVVLTEKNLGHFVLQAMPSLENKVTAYPNRAAQILEKWLPETVSN
jgi:hypothetical protein